MMMSRHVLKEEYDDDEQTRPEKRTEEEHVIEKPAGATPTYAEAYNNLGVLYRDAAMLGVYVWEYMHCLKIDPDSRNVGQFVEATIRIRAGPQVINIENRGSSVESFLKSFYTELWLLLFSCFDATFVELLAIFVRRIRQPIY